jgi:hypothetical protein
VDLPIRGSLEHVASIQIEMLLRQYGITSANRGTTLELRRNEDGSVVAHLGGAAVTGYSQDQLEALYRLGGGGRWRRFAGVNVQTTRTVSTRPLQATLVDFGHYKVHESFRDPVLSTVRGRPLQWGGVLAPDDPRFPNPDPAHRVDSGAWRARPIDPRAARRLGLPGGFVSTPTLELAMILATRWRAGELDGEGVRAALEEHVAEATAGWR